MFDSGLPISVRRVKFRMFCVLILIHAGISLSPKIASAQLSPGKLTLAHEHLEGVRRCNSCHKLGDRNIVSKCLECHREIASSQEREHGLHALQGYANCNECHVEHQGRDHDLVFWPQGESGFDHGSIGYRLEGKHAELTCARCHTARYIADPSPLVSAGKDLERTRMGLRTSCTDCHDEVHVPAFSGICTECHDQNAWKPVPGFKHNATAFPLTGRHEPVPCLKCHPPLDEASPVAGAAKFRGVAHTACTDCHRDPHDGRLGSRCTDCHSTTGWSTVAGEGFDHDRTRYPLRGRHASVRCERCHATSDKRPTFAACTDCHDDVHRGNSNDRPRLTRCEECHDVDGFRPARYALDRHRTSAYPLEGAHLATPCAACHRPEDNRDRPFALMLDHGACTACHDDPHGRPSAGGVRLCTTCHDQGTWRSPRFDHATTGYTLVDRHAQAACLACHRGADDTPPVFTTTPTACASCHDDIHLGQFAVAGEPELRCDRCHVTVDWYAERFDHDSHSRFALRGGHESVACARCHVPLDQPGGRSLIFKPLTMECADCHKSTPVPTGGNP